MKALLIGWILDFLLGDPVWLPHPVVYFGKTIAWCERQFNRNTHRFFKGAVVALGVVVAVFVGTWLLLALFDGWSPAAGIGLRAVLVFYCLAGTTLIREVRQVFAALERSLDAGRQQVARIVGRDTALLSAQEVRQAALETLAENLSDGVVAPLFWLACLGVPGMMAYKMVNTLDSMIGYRTERYQAFGCFAARMDDVANYLPARLTALLMVVCSSAPRTLFARLRFVRRYASQHTSPNSGYPEAALAAILDCRFGGPHYYFGQLFPKPYIGGHDRLLTVSDLHRAVCTSRATECVAVIIVLLTQYFL